MANQDIEAGIGAHIESFYEEPLGKILKRSWLIGVAVFSDSWLYSGALSYMTASPVRTSTWLDCALWGRDCATASVWFSGLSVATAVAIFLARRINSGSRFQRFLRSRITELICVSLTLLSLAALTAASIILS
ncbi:hypothetical protein FRC03_008081 [Tulasnella sp. 419]|nr:hypothetical protein FRC03_008081 [Tulasnella sp. 419]